MTTVEMTSEDMTDVPLATTLGEDVKEAIKLSDNIVVLITLLLMAAFILFGNIMIALAVKTTPRIQDQPNHRFFLSLAAADGVMAISMIFMALRMVAFTKPVFDSNKWACLTCYTISILSGLQSLFTLLLMAVDRLLCVQSPFFYARHATDTLYRWVVGVSWIIILIFSSFPFYYNGFDPHIGCIAMGVLTNDAVKYALSLPGIICTTLCSICYLKITFIAWQQRKKIRAETMFVTVQPARTVDLTSVTEQNTEVHRLSDVPDHRQASLVSNSNITNCNSKHVKEQNMQVRCGSVQVEHVSVIPDQMQGSSSCHSTAECANERNAQKAYVLGGSKPTPNTSHRAGRVEFDAQDTDKLDFQPAQKHVAFVNEKLLSVKCSNDGNYSKINSHNQQLSQQKWNQQQQQQGQPNQQHQILPPQHQQRQQPPPPNQQQRQQLKSTGLFLSLNMLFVVCWVPFFVNCWFSGVYKFAERLSPPVMFIAMTNSALNFVVYALKNKDFARAFRRLLTPWRHR